MSATSIEWTDQTWNPVVGCTPVSPGCLNCYAATMARRLEAMGRPDVVRARGREPRGPGRAGPDRADQAVQGDRVRSMA